MFLNLEGDESIQSYEWKLIANLIERTLLVIMIPVIVFLVGMVVQNFNRTAGRE